MPSRVGIVVLAVTAFLAAFSIAFPAWHRAKKEQTYVEAMTFRKGDIAWCETDTSFYKGALSVYLLLPHLYPSDERYNLVVSDPPEGMTPTQQEQLALSLEIRILVDDIAVQTYSGNLIPTCGSVGARCVKLERFSTLEEYIEAAAVIHVRLLQGQRVIIDEERAMKEGDSEHLPPGVVVGDYLLGSGQYRHMRPPFTQRAQMTAHEPN